MKKQIIAAAVAASMSAVALADVSITGATKLNWTSTDGTKGVTNVIGTEIDLFVVGKVGDTEVHVNLEDKNNSDSFAIKNNYLTTNVGGVAVKAGTWYTGDSNLNDAGEQGERVSLTTDMGPMSINFQHEPSAAVEHNEVTVKAAIGGINVSYEMENTDAHKILGLSGDISGVKFAYTDSDSDAATDEESGYSLTTDIAGMTVTYQHAESTKGTTSDGFFGTHAKDKSYVIDASGFGITTALAGNTVHVRNYEVKSSTSADGTVDATKRDTKVIVTRKLASGATAEVTYVTGDSATSLDVELAVAF
jgi:hypothetical protein